MPVLHIAKKSLRIDQRGYLILAKEIFFVKIIAMNCDTIIHATMWREVRLMPPQLHTTDRYNMAERIQIRSSLCYPSSNVFRIFDACRLTSDYQRIEEVT